MRVPRLYCPQPLRLDATISLSKELTHYLGRVLRLNVGAQVVLFNGEGGEYLATLDTLNKNDSTATLHTFRDPQTDPRLPIHLIQGISRGERMQYVIQKAVELGASSLQPVFTEYCEVKLDGERAEKRQEHWQSIANSACEQCGRTRLMVIHPANKLTNWLANTPNHDAQHIRLTLDPYVDQHINTLQTQISEVSLLIGPEGGLSDNEVALAKQHGFIGVKLGPRILRTETATAAGLTTIQMKWGDF